MVPGRLVEPVRPVGARVGRPGSMSPRLWTTLPLPTTSTPRRATARAGRPARGGTRGLAGVDRQLHDRDIRVGEGVHEHRPCAVIDAPAVVVEAHPHGCRLGDLLGSAGSPGAGYDLEQLVGEAVEVVDGAGRAMAVTAEALMYQWAETTRMPRGAGDLRPKARHARCSGCARARSWGCRVRRTRPASAQQRRSPRSCRPPAPQQPAV